ncbi:MAG: endodeoxyribonuclease RusA [Hyphomicrobiales bacterium]|nr:endodeoxyribonuclease RusA [Hyphomicrobiales bacterium]
MSVAFSIPGEPIAFARSGGRGTVRFTPKRQRDHMALIQLAAHRAMDGQAPMAGALRMSIRATYIVPKGWSRKRSAEAKWRTSRPDVDNIAKLIADAINAIVYEDDAQVAALHVEKRYGPLPGIVVTVEPLDVGGGA